MSTALIIQGATAPALVVDEQARQQVRELLPELPSYIENAVAKINDDPQLYGRVLTSEEKGTICRIYANGGSIVETCEAVGISPPTLYHRLEHDEEFRRAFSLAKHSLGDKIQGKSVSMALQDKGTIDRMCQLKRFFPSVYRESNNQVAVGVSINLGACLARPQQPPA